MVSLSVFHMLVGARYFSLFSTVSKLAVWPTLPTVQLIQVFFSGVKLVEV
jgi:hypothetical protein